MKDLSRKVWILCAWALTRLRLKLACVSQCHGKIARCQPVRNGMQHEWDSLLVCNQIEKRPTIVGCLKDCTKLAWKMYHGLLTDSSQPIAFRRCTFLLVENLFMVLGGVWKQCWCIWLLSSLNMSKPCMCLFLAESQHPVLHGCSHGSFTQWPVTDGVEFQVTVPQCEWPGFYSESTLGVSGAHRMTRSWCRRQSNLQ